MLKISIPRMALMNQAHTVIGRRGRVMPWVRRSMVVTLKLIALSNEVAQKMETLAIQRVMPDRGDMRNAAVIPTSEETLAQNASRLRVGKAISRAPICSGRK